MQFKNCETLRIVETGSKISKEDMKILTYSADTKEDFLVQNYIQKQILLFHGESFIEKSQPRIEAILYYLTKQKDEELYEMYRHSFDSFIKSVNYNYEKVNSFNLIFIFYINISRRLLRRAAEKANTPT